MSVWDPCGMKAEIILAKSWIQTPKEGYGNRFDEFLKFCLEGGRAYNFVFFGRGRIFVNNRVFLTKCSRNGSP